MELALGASLADKLLFGLRVMLLGMGTVFSILFILWFVLFIFEKVFGIKRKTKAEPDVPTVTPAAAPPVETAADEGDETELIAVLTAAICAASGGRAEDIRIVSYKRKKTPWNR